MTGDQAHSKPDGYWDRAGEQGYGQAMYRSSDVESHVRGRVWQTAIDIAGALGVPADGHVLDLGCGDGAFANQMLAGRYRKVDGIDKSEAAIKRANAESRNLATYRAVDLVTFDYDSLPRYAAAFLNVFPNFTPGFICRWLKPIEPRIEQSRIGNALCTVDMYGLTLAR